MCADTRCFQVQFGDTDPAKPLWHAGYGNWDELGTRSPFLLHKSSKARRNFRGISSVACANKVLSPCLHQTSPDKINRLIPKVRKKHVRLAQDFLRFGGVVGCLACSDHGSLAFWLPMPHVSQFMLASVANSWPTETCMHISEMLRHTHTHCGLILWL